MANWPGTSSTAILVGLAALAGTDGFKCVRQVDRSDDAPLPQQEFPARKGARVGRNAPCPCGSGRKFKACCREG